MRQFIVGLVRLLFVLVPIAMFVNVSTALAVTIKSLEFEVDGVLPSSEPDIEFFKSYAESEESAVYSVSDGFLHQRTFSSDANSSYTYPENSLSTGDLDSGLTTIMETRLQVFQIAGQAGCFFQALDGANRYLMFFEPSGVGLFTTSGVETVALNVFGPNTYRLESPGNSNVMNLFVDNVFSCSALAPPMSLNGFNWGDTNLVPMQPGNKADADWDFVRVSQIPEPSTVVLLSMGAVALLVYALRKRK